MINDESRDNDENNTLDDKRKITTPTIGEAVKEAVKTGEEVILQGETFAGEPTGITENLSIENNEEKEKETGKEGEVVLYSTTTSADSEMEVGVAELMEEVSPVEDRIVIDTGEAKDRDEITIAPITSIPVEGAGIEVEVQTEIEVPVEDKDKEVESESKLKVEGENLSKELSLDPSRTKTLDENENENRNGKDLDDKDNLRPPVFDRTEKSFEDALNETKDNVERFAEIMSKVKESQSLTQGEKYIEMQESFNRSLEETKNNVEVKAEKAESDGNNNGNDNNEIGDKKPKSNNVNDMTTTLFNESLQNCMNYQKQAFDALQSFWEAAVRNYNIPLWTYWSMPKNISDMYLEMVKNYTNTMGQTTKLMNDMIFSFINAFNKK